MKKNIFIFTLPIWQTLICLVFVALFFSPIESIPILLISLVVYFFWYLYTKFSLLEKEKGVESISDKASYSRLSFLTTSSFILWFSVLNSAGFLVNKINPQAQKISFFASDANIATVILFAVFPIVSIVTSMMLVYLHLKKPAQNLETIKS